MTTSAATAATPAIPSREPKPLTVRGQRTGVLIALWAFVIIPFLALIAAIPIAWGGWLSWTDAIIATVFYWVTGLGVTIGFHRGFTHGSFKTKRWLRVALAVAGSMAIEGAPTQWVADHRRHHAFSDVEGDPHSPWRYGNGLWGLTKGMLWAHVGWLFRRDVSNKERFAPDLLADKDFQRVDRLFGPLVAVSLLSPALIGGLLSMSWQGALAAFFWASLVRVALLHHVTWSINSVCHVVGERPFETRDGDKAANFWPLAIISFGENWHNLHHADPTCARHGALRGQLDPSARVIWAFEKLGWANDVRWPRQERLDRLLGRVPVTAGGARPAGPATGPAPDTISG